MLENLDAIRVRFVTRGLRSRSFDLHAKLPSYDSRTTCRNENMDVVQTARFAYQRVRNVVSLYQQPPTPAPSCDTLSETIDGRRRVGRRIG